MENYTPINGKYKLLKSHTNSYITATSSKNQTFNLSIIKYNSTALSLLAY